MRKTIILWMMFFMIFSYAFADDNTIESGNNSFSWQLFYQENSQNMDFLALNPMFFYNNNEYFVINFIENISKNNRPQNIQRRDTNSVENNFCLVGSILFFTGVGYVHSSMSRQERMIYNNRWEQQVEEEKMYRRIFFDNNRNFYGNY